VKCWSAASTAIAGDIPATRSSSWNYWKAIWKHYAKGDSNECLSRLQSGSFLLESARRVTVRRKQCDKLFSRVAPPSHLPNPAPDALSAGLFYERQHSVGPLFMPLTIYAGILATMAIATPRPIKPNAVRSQSQR
jgi:hypothetical protein